MTQETNAPGVVLGKMVVDGKTWLQGYGTIPAQYMFIGEKPCEADISYSAINSGAPGKLLLTTCMEQGFDTSKVYFTNAVKYVPPNKKAVTSSDVKACADTLTTEISMAAAPVIVCMGAVAFKAVVGSKYGFSDYRGTFIDHPKLENVKVFAMYNPSYIIRNPEMTEQFKQDIRLLQLHQAGAPAPVDKTLFLPIDTVEQLKAFIATLFELAPNPFLAIDAEWHGVNWMDPNRYTRSVQISWTPGWAAVIHFRGVGGVPIMDDEPQAWALLKELCEDPRVSLAGHNIISDGEWLLPYGVDLRKRTVIDTMLNEHLINESGPFGLEVLTTKYTNLGRYDIPVMQWKMDHKSLCSNGFGHIPAELLDPYSATDADATLRIAIAQMPLIKTYQQPRGEYPSLWDTVMQTQQAIYELERTGLLIDQERLRSLINVYAERLEHVESQLKLMANQYGMADFNHRSTTQVRQLLYENIGLVPIKTTSNKKWKDGLNQDIATAMNQKASTDKTTLEILQERHPIAKLLLNTRRIDTVVKYFLRDDDDDDDTVNESSQGGGIAAKIWPDGRLHPHFSQLSETGRFRHSKPNVANWPKKGEGYMEYIFGGKDKMPPLIRTIVIPQPGFVLMEADFIQAELFVLAALSRDQNMWDALTTPGKDLHDLTAVSSFKLEVLGPDGNPIPEQYLLDLAKSDKKAFKSLQETLQYRKLDGKILSRKVFKSGLRISAKNLNFGIPYGRGAEDIARQVKGETGTSESLESLAADIQKMMDTWKTETYKDAWTYMTECADSVKDPGYIVNPWGRVRHFSKTTDSERQAGMQREAQNFPIQSTVADTCMLAMWRMRQYREQHGLHFRMVNQIHDAVMLEVPIEEIEQTKIMFQNTMGNISIPLQNRAPLVLGVDISVLDRWGEDREE
jgi:DNA polymerase-1